MPRFNLSYACDVPSYANFSIEAESAEAALKEAERLLKEGAFGNVPTEVDWGWADSYRVFLTSETPTGPDDADEDVSLLEGFDTDKLLAQAKGGAR